MKYIILEAGDIRDLSKLVNLKIAEGWTPKGGVSNYVYYKFNQYNSPLEIKYNWFIQALVLESNPHER